MAGRTHPLGALQEKGHLLVPDRGPCPHLRVRPESLPPVIGRCMQLDSARAVSKGSNEQSSTSCAVNGIEHLLAETNDNIWVEVHTSR